MSFKWVNTVKSHLKLHLVYMPQCIWRKFIKNVENTLAMSKFSVKNVKQITNCRWFNSLMCFPHSSRTPTTATENTNHLHSWPRMRKHSSDALICSCVFRINSSRTPTTATENTNHLHSWPRMRKRSSDALIYSLLMCFPHSSHTHSNLALASLCSLIWNSNNNPTD